MALYLPVFPMVELDARRRVRDDWFFCKLTGGLMKLRFLVALGFATLLSACGSQKQEAVVDATQVDEFSRRFVSVVLPVRADLSFPYVLTSDRLYTRNDGGETRRGLMLEFTDSTSASIASTVIDDFKKVGYKLRKEPDVKENGQSSFALVKNGSVNIYVDVRPAGDRKLTAAGAAGTVWLSWRVRGADAKDSDLLAVPE